jgi:hypothetical protein
VTVDRYESPVIVMVDAGTVDVMLTVVVVNSAVKCIGSLTKEYRGSLGVTVTVVFAEALNVSSVSSEEQCAAECRRVKTTTVSAMMVAARKMTLQYRAMRCQRETST